MTVGRTRPVYLVRHAIAEERGLAWPDDSLRPLTHRGKARMRQIVSGLVALGVELDAVHTSPLVRAVETAELLAQGLPTPPDVTVTTALAPGQPIEAVRRVLARTARGRSVALVGHEPGLGELAAWLLGAPEPLLFKKGGVCRLDVDRLPPQGACRLAWFATPRMLRALGD